MKRLSEAQRRYLIYRGRKVIRKRTRENAKKARLKLGSSELLYQNFLKKVSLYRDGKFEQGFSLSGALEVPEVLSFSENYNQTATFLQDVRGRLALSWKMRFHNKQKFKRAVLQTKMSGVGHYYDFTKIKNISIPVALVLASEYDCVRRDHTAVPRAVDYENWNPQVRMMLDGIGFLEMAGINSSGPAFLEGDNLRILRFRSGSEADGELVDLLLRQLGVPEALEDTAIYDAIIEALVNTRHHAYPKGLEFPRPHFPGWWLTALVDKRDRRVVISVFDRGLGIPATLVDWDRYDVFERGWRRLFQEAPNPEDTRNDGTAIRVAMAVGRSSTGQAHRGKGLPSMEAALDLCRDGSITIYSRCGAYKRAKGARAHTLNLNAPVGGTLISWDLGF
ncbi:hypothetical protein MKK88_13260 [Methylobacterium sp. E-005]|uniref:hypothetical protein n=1 Tax=Methylobacterium sp. E-005 TaxID=2836549 RepID=UPI001FBA0298|nr:hypothetical protein [Methylobacterium sp. E-005]MCJ2086950.1 hypothetical protein [Methylobacterium sp. E-005]